MVSKALKGVNMITDFKITEDSLVSLYEGKQLFSLDFNSISGVSLAQNNTDLILEVEEDKYKEGYLPTHCLFFT